MPESRQENIDFTLLPQNYLPFGWGGGHEIYNFIQIGQVVLVNKKTMLQDDTQPPTHSNSSPE